MTGSYHSLLLFFLLACSFVSRDISFIYDVRVRAGGGGGGLDVERDSSSFFESVSCLALLLSLLSGLYRVHRLRVSSLCPVARTQFLPLPSSPPPPPPPSSLPPCVFSFSFFLGLLALSYPLVSLPDLGSHFAFLFSSAFVYILMLCHRSF